jgi:hypothetical protein
VPSYQLWNSSADASSTGLLQARSIALWSAMKDLLRLGRPFGGLLREPADLSARTGVCGDLPPPVFQAHPGGH